MKPNMCVISEEKKKWERCRVLCVCVCVSLWFGNNQTTCPLCRSIL
ncbi:BnaA09g28280D [Brassica napus]|uniref:(rape) hypothetical protein n=1 Tax=Brassica napus TaxID=3708 RepID=A0A078GQW2_BRANA|nr:unnamed protein product [Brassica napus]CDY27579.1 BnaA09g28280D [Brassica napus]